jgi:hypothetical protein
MTDRRSLIEGLKETPSPINTGVEKQFVYRDKPAATNNTVAAIQPTPTMNRVPISTRMREDFAKALKRASLERQLKGIEPNTLQDILEEAIEPWLKSNGYLG